MSLKSMEVTHSPAYREVLIVSGVQGAQVKDRSPPVVGFGH